MSHPNSHRLLAPIGDHQRKYVLPSQGKRARKKLKLEATSRDLGPSPPPPPEIKKHITIGFSCTHRALEALTAQLRPEREDAQEHVYDKDHAEGDVKPIAAIFIDRSSQPPIMHNHLPVLVLTASTALQSETDIRLVTLPNGSSPRLSSALHIPHAGQIGVLQDAPDARPLLDLVREKVPAIDKSWLNVGTDASYLPLNVDTKTVQVEVQPSKAIRRREEGKQDVVAKKALPSR